MALPAPLPREMERHLSCSSCGHLLSIGPVTKSPTGFRCGRCPSQDAQEQCLLYEITAHAFLYPCRNKRYGCGILLPFGYKMKHHEDFCDKKPYLCPAAKSIACTWQGSYNEIEEHLKTQHEELVLKVLSMEIDVQAIETKGLYYFSKNGPGLFIELRYCKEIGLSVEVLLMLRNEAEITSFKDDYVMALSAPPKNGTISYTRTLGKLFLDTGLQRIHRRNNTINRDFLKCLTTGRRKLKIEFQLKFPQITPSTMVYYTACRNRVHGCDFMALHLQTQTHENSCVTYECPLEPDTCRWQGLVHTFAAHCSQKHQLAEQQLVVGLDQLMANGKRTVFYLLQCKTISEDAFRVCIQLRDGAQLSLHVEVQYLGKATEAVNYAYTVEFKDRDASNKMTFDCMPYSCKDVFKFSECFEWYSIKNCTLTFVVIRKVFSL